jgi:transmembrane sensor
MDLNMDDIYIILSKHFLNEAKKVENEEALDFKLKNPKEYKLLSELWKKNEVEFYEFDKQKAWDKLSSIIDFKEENNSFLRWNIRNAAATIAFMIISVLTIIYFCNGSNFADRIIEENHTANPKLIELEDGSKIWLSSKSLISYSEKFIKDKREVALSGKAFFEVSKDNNHPFIVSTNNSSITVLGTSFNIDETKHRTEISVKSGKVKVESTVTNEQVFLNPNQFAIVTEEKLIVSEVTNPNYQSWINGIFKFKNTPIKQVIYDLNTFYNNQFELDSSKEYDCNLTAKFEKSDINTIVEVLEKTCDLNSKQAFDKILLR